MDASGVSPLSSMDVVNERHPPLDVNTADQVYSDASVAARVPLTIDMPLLRSPPLMSGSPDVEIVFKALLAREKRSLRCARPYADINWQTPDQELYKVLMLMWLRLFATQYGAIGHIGSTMVVQAWRFFRQRTLILSQRVGDAATRWIEQVLRDEVAQRDFGPLLERLAPIDVEQPNQAVRDLQDRVTQLTLAQTSAAAASDAMLDSERKELLANYRDAVIMAMLPPPTLQPIHLPDTTGIDELTVKNDELKATIAAYQRHQRKTAAAQLDLEKSQEEMATARRALAACKQTEAERDRLRAQLAAGAAAYVPESRRQMAPLLIDVALPSPLLFRTLGTLARASVPRAESVPADEVARLTAKNALLEAQVSVYKQQQGDAARTQIKLDKCRAEAAEFAAVRKERDQLKQQVSAGAAFYEGIARRNEVPHLITAALPPAPLFLSLGALMRTVAPLPPAANTDTVADLRAENTELKATVAAYERRAPSAAAAVLERDEYKELVDSLKTVRADRDRLRAQLAAGVAPAGSSQLLIDAALPSAPLLRMMADVIHIRRSEASTGELRIQLDHAKRTVATKTDELVGAQRALADLRDQLAKKQKDADDLARAFGQATAELDTVRQQGATAASEAQRSLRADLERANALSRAKDDELNEARRRISDGESALVALQNDLDSARLQAADAQRKLAAKEEELSTAQRTLSATIGTLAIAQSDLAAKEKELERLRGSSDESVRAQLERVNELQRRLAAKEAELEAMRTAVDSSKEFAQRELVRAQERLAGTEAELADVRASASASADAAQRELAAVRQQAEQVQRDLQSKFDAEHARATEFKGLFNTRNEELDVCQEETRKLEQQLAAVQSSNTAALEAMLAQERNTTALVQDQASEYFAQLREFAVRDALPSPLMLSMAASFIAEANRHDVELKKVREETAMQYQAELADLREKKKRPTTEARQSDAVQADAKTASGSLSKKTRRPRQSNDQ